jgi:hypothetical protein
MSGCAVGLAMTVWTEPARALPLGTYGAITFIFAGAVLAASVDRVRRWTGSAAPRPSMPA